MNYFNGFLPILGVTDDSLPTIERNYLELLDALDIHFQDYPYVLGGRPSFADFGLMAPLFAHLARDPVPASLMKNKAPNVYRWTERMNLAAIADASALHASIGAARVEQRVRELSQRLKSGVADMGLGLVTPMDPALSGGVCIVDVSADRRNEVWNRLYTEHGIAGATTGGLRLCPHVYNTTAHVDRALAGIRALMVG